MCPKITSLFVPNQMRQAQTLTTVMNCFSDEYLEKRDIAVLSPWKDDRGALVSIDRLKDDGLVELINKKLKPQVGNSLVVFDHVSFSIRVMRRPATFYKTFKVMCSELVHGISDHSPSVASERMKWVDKTQANLLFSIGDMNYVNSVKTDIDYRLARGECSGFLHVEIYIYILLREIEFGYIPADNFITRS